MSSLIQSKRSDSTAKINEHCIFKADNITIIPMYHTRDRLIIYPAVIIAEKSGLSIGLAIDTYSIRLFHDRRRVHKPNLFYKCQKIKKTELKFNG